ncbi:hypothetical protein [Oceanobacillus timonensis]|uniref:hypothetical protein n=1 Tax=Oceanobacillus timonensis TaxID=1926285 RepID=UPI00118105FD|nr:hypothetical protein [Oceanobacillus timonensis]
MNSTLKSPNHKDIQKEYDRLLAEISNKVDRTKLSKNKPLKIDKNGNVNISPDHPNYKFWTEDD